MQVLLASDILESGASRSAAALSCSWVKDYCTWSPKTHISDGRGIGQGREMHAQIKVSLESTTPSLHLGGPAIWACRILPPLRVPPSLCEGRGRLTCRLICSHLPTSARVIPHRWCGLHCRCPADRTPGPLRTILPSPLQAPGFRPAEWADLGLRKWRRLVRVV